MKYGFPLLGIANRWRWRFRSVWLVAIAVSFAPCHGAETDQQFVFFERNIRPLFSNYCFKCHALGKASKGGLQLDSREGLLRGGKHGSAVDLVEPTNSLLLRMVQPGTDGVAKMPPGGRLPKAQVDQITQWISDGAVWPSTPESATGAESTQASDFWSLQPVADPPLPEVRDQSWPRKPVDYFILHEFEKLGLRPVPPADKSTLLRRVTFDLIGLPPTVEELNEFLADSSEAAFERVVDRLLANPHYGERWARHWLDLVRYADTNGMDRDTDKPNMFHYRDYVIEAFNEDVSYDLFVKEQIAGDLIDNPRVSADGTHLSSPIGSGFHWLVEMYDFVNAEMATEVENQIDVLGKCFLGLTLGCARCHDHKFDPISNSDYVAMVQCFERSSNTLQCLDTPAQRQQIATHIDELQSIDQQIEAICDWADLGQKVFERCQLNAARVDDYLMASREFMLADVTPSASEINQVAQRDSLDAKQLQRWMAKLDTARAVEGDPFRPWAMLARFTPERFASRARSLRRLLTSRDREESDQPSETVVATATVNSENSADAETNRQTVDDFEAGDFSQWTVIGDAFGTGPVASASARVEGAQGLRVASSYRATNALEGRLVSPRIRVKKPYLSFLIAGGNYPQQTGVQIVAQYDSAPVVRQSWASSGNHSHTLERRTLDLSVYVGREIHIEIIDQHCGEWGHIVVDDLYFTDSPPVELPTAVANSEPNRSGSPCVLECLSGPGLQSHLGLAQQYRDALVRALEEWKRVQPENRFGWWALDQAMETSQAELPSVGASSKLGPFRKWAIAADSPLRVAANIEAFLSADQVNTLSSLRRRRRELIKTVPQSTIALVSSEQCRLNRELLFRQGEREPQDSFGPFLKILQPEWAKPQGSGRRELATLIGSADNPLTARVIVNRIWQHHFGRGLVATPDNFGKMGAKPSHPALLDFLAHAFMQAGWSMKALHRELVLSSTYRQSSVTKTAAADSDVDPYNRLYQGLAVRRLDAECIRDAILALAGSLNLEMYGPGVPLYRTHFNEFNEYIPRESGPLNGDGRRSIYLEVRRNTLSKFLSDFDSPPPDNTMGLRPVSFVPAQSLQLLNSPFVHQQSEVWATRLLEEPASNTQRIRRLFVEAFARQPTASELEACGRFVAERQLQAQRGTATDANSDLPASRTNPTLFTNDKQPWADLCHVLINLSDFVLVR